MTNKCSFDIIQVKLTALERGVKMRERIPIEVRALMHSDGRLIPESVIVREREYPITRILKISNTRPWGVACVAPLEYTVDMDGRIKNIYYEGSSGSWFAVADK